MKGVYLIIPYRSTTLTLMPISKKRQAELDSLNGQAQKKPKKILPFRWYGGKFSQLKWLLPIINSVPHKCYVEVFGGSGAVLLNKNRSPIEVYNDIYSDVVTFFKVLRTNGQELIDLLSLTPHSREEFENSIHISKEYDTDLEQARKFFVRASMCTLGRATNATKGHYSYSITHSRRGISKSVSGFLSNIDNLPLICSRMRECQIENLDFRRLIPKYDRPGTLFYLDPPYVLESRSGGIGYRHEMTRKDHLDLIDIIKSVKEKVILSGYESDLYRKHLGGWITYNPSSKMSSAARGRSNNLLRQEILWMNFDHEQTKTNNESDQ